MADRDPDEQRELRSFLTQIEAAREMLEVPDLTPEEYAQAVLLLRDAARSTLRMCKDSPAYAERCVAHIEETTETLCRLESLGLKVFDG